MKYLTILFISFILISCNDNHVVISESSLQEIAEVAYFEGQKDYSEGDIRIKFNFDSCYIWNKSPWDDNRTPLFHPSFNCK